MNKIILIAGPSGVGKGTIEKELFKNEKLNISFSVSATTRKPREGEKEGKHYYFISKEKFCEKIEKNEFIEWSQHLGNYYGTLKSEVELKLKKNFNVLIEVETIGSINIINSYKENPNYLITIFIKPPSLEELENRIVNRNSDDVSSIKMRMEKAKIEIKEANKFKYCIINNEIESSVREITKIIEKETK